MAATNAPAEVVGLPFVATIANVTAAEVHSFAIEEATPSLEEDIGLGFRLMP